MKGKKGLIMGVANERSIAWGIAQKLSEAGAELAFTYLGDALKKRVIPLAEKLNSKVTFSCDVEKKEDVKKLFENIRSKWGEIDFVVHAVAFSDKTIGKVMSKVSPKKAAAVGAGVGAAGAAIGKKIKQSGKKAGEAMKGAAKAGAVGAVGGQASRKMRGE